MRYINSRFTCLLAYLLTMYGASSLSYGWVAKANPDNVIWHSGDGIEVGWNSNV